MRQLKFRCWDGEQMVSPDYISRTGTAWWKEDGIPTFSEKVMQFTGLHDCDEKEIYEGDIVNCWGGEQAQGFYEISIKGEIVYSHNAFLIKDQNNVHYDPSHFDCQLKIIGNICENPELLNYEL